MKSLGLTKCPSVLERALEFSKGQTRSPRSNWSAPNSPRLRDGGDTNSASDRSRFSSRPTAGTRAQEWMATQEQEGALGMLEMPHDEDRGRMDREFDLNGNDSGESDSDIGIVDQMPVRKEGESVDDYILRCTEALERAALAEFNM